MGWACSVMHEKCFGPGARRGAQIKSQWSDYARGRGGTNWVQCKVDRNERGLLIMEMEVENTRVLIKA